MITSIEARPFKVPFYKASHSKGIKERALHVHQRKTKHFITKLLAQPYRLLHTFSILVYGLLKNAYWSSVLDMHGLFKKWEMVRRMSY